MEHTKDHYLDIVRPIIHKACPDAGHYSVCPCLMSDCQNFLDGRNDAPITLSHVLRAMNQLPDYKSLIGVFSDGRFAAFSGDANDNHWATFPNEKATAEFYWNLSSDRLENQSIELLKWLSEILQ